LYLTHAWSRTIYGQTQYNPPSRFLGEMPEHLFDVRESEGATGGGRYTGGRHGGRGTGAGGYPAAGRGGPGDRGRRERRRRPSARGLDPRSPRACPCAGSGDRRGRHGVHERWGGGWCSRPRQTGASRRHRGHDLASEVGGSGCCSPTRHSRKASWRADGISRAPGQIACGQPATSGRQAISTFRVTRARRQGPQARPVHRSHVRPCRPRVS
jgi:hypothetical protein